MVTARFLRDDRGFRRCEVAPPHEAVGWFVEQDIQGSQLGAAEWMDLIDSVLAGDLPRYSATGNAFHLELSGGVAQIECIWDDSMPVCRVGLAELRQVVAVWHSFLGEPS